MAHRLPTLAGRFALRTLLAPSSTAGLLARTAPLRCTAQHGRTSIAPSGVAIIRAYSSGRGDDSGDERQEVKAFAFQMMNPVSWLRIKLNTMYIQSRIDKEFTLENFMFGAAQAFKVLLRCLTTDDYNSLEGLVTNEAIDWLRENYHGADPDLDFSLRNDELIVRKPKNIDITELNGDLSRVHVDTLFAAVKIKEKSYMITGVLRFQRDYTSGKPSEWIISEVQQLVVKEVGSISF